MNEPKELPQLKGLPPKLGVGEAYVAKADVRKAIAHRPDWESPVHSKSVPYGNESHLARFSEFYNGEENTYEVKGADGTILGKEIVRGKLGPEGQHMVIRTFIYPDGTPGNTLQVLIGHDQRVTQTDVLNPDGRVTSRVTVIHPLTQEGLAYEKVTYYDPTNYDKKDRPETSEFFDTEGNLRKNIEYHYSGDIDEISLYRQDGTLTYQESRGNEGDREQMVVTKHDYSADGRMWVRRETVVTGSTLSSKLLNDPLPNFESRIVDTKIITGDTAGIRTSKDTIKRSTILVDGKWTLIEESISRTNILFENMDGENTIREYDIVNGGLILRKETQDTSIKIAGQKEPVTTHRVRIFDVRGKLVDIN